MNPAGGVKTPLDGRRAGRGEREGLAGTAAYPRASGKCCEATRSVREVATELKELASLMRTAQRA